MLVRKYVRESDQNQLAGAFDGRGYLVRLQLDGAIVDADPDRMAFDSAPRLEVSTPVIAVSRDYASNRQEALQVALDRTRTAFQRPLIISAEVVLDTDEARKQWDRDGAEFAVTDPEFLNVWYQLTEREDRLSDALAAAATFQEV